MRAGLQVRSMSKEEAMLYAQNPANRTIVAIPILLVVSFLFYFLSAFFSYLSASSAASDPMAGATADSNAAADF